MSYRETVASAAGARPSKAVGILLDQIMLPGEPVEFALKGTIRLQPTWVVVTPAWLLVIRDGMNATIEGVAGMAEYISWRVEESWGDTKLHLELGGQRVTVTQVKPARATEFIQTMEWLGVSGLVGGWPPVLAPVFAAADAVTSSMLDANPIAEPDEVIRALRHDMFSLVAGNVHAADALTFELGLLLNVLGSDLPEFADASRRSIALMSVSGVHGVDAESLYVVRSFRAISRGGDTAAAASSAAGLKAMADFLTATMATLAPGSGDERRDLHEAAQQLREISRPRIDTVKRPKALPQSPAGASVDDEIVERLERLHRLKSSGALTEDEFATLKAQVLGF